jgi:hypothetical protein
VRGLIIINDVNVRPARCNSKGQYPIGWGGALNDWMNVFENTKGEALNFQFFINTLIDDPPPRSVGSERRWYHDGT